MINIVFNGVDRRISTNVLADIVAEVRKGSGPCAVAVNQAFVPQSDYAATQLQDGDQVEVLVPMQGG